MEDAISNVNQEIMTLMSNLLTLRQNLCKEMGSCKTASKRKRSHLTMSDISADIQSLEKR
jgi:hypothetical protein